MENRIYRNLAPVLIATNLNGCAALIAHEDENRWGTPYAGVKLYADNRCAHDFIRALWPVMVPLAIIDFPLTLITDTVFLPIDLAITPGVPKRQSCYEQPIPMTFSQYFPEATWGKRSEPGGCLPPTITIEQSEFPRLTIEIGLKNDVLAKALRLKDPTLFIHLHRPAGTFVGLFTDSLTNRSATPVRIKASASTLNFEFADGTLRRVDVPELTQEMILVGEKVIQVTLKDVEPQSLVVTVPTFMVDGKELGGGTINFSYGKTTAVCGISRPPA
jgi:uncharacterized protein YceK